MQKVCCCLCLAALSLTSCSGTTLNLAGGENNKRDNPAGESSAGKLFYLDLNSPTIVQAIESRDEAAGRRFVRVEVVEVQNPKKYPVTFQVHYQPSAGEKIYLGSFGLFPSDNPGKFIVSTQGKLKDEGSILLTLVVGSKVEAADTVKVGVKKITFVNE